MALPDTLTSPKGALAVKNRALLASIVVVLVGAILPLWAQPPADVGQGKPPDKVLRVPRTDDFEVNGRGDAPAWEKARWEPLHARSADGRGHQTRVKVLYSATGLYVLMDAADRAITATMKEDFLDLWKEDVFEFFLWPDERYPVYFEYEISPLGFELPILIPNFDGKFLGWRPGTTKGPEKPARPPRSPAGRSSRAPRCPAGRPRSSSPTTCSTRWRMSPQSPEPGGGPISIAWIMTSAAARAGTGRGSAPASTSSSKFGTLVFE